MAFALDYSSLDTDDKKKINKDLIIKGKKTQYNQDPICYKVFDKEDDTIYLPLRKYSDFLEKFPHLEEEYDRTNLEFKYKLFTKETDPSGRGRDQDVLVKEAIKRLDCEHSVFISAHTGYGKCLAPGTKVLMFDGTKKNVEEISVGDKIMGDDSTHRNILSICQGNEEMFEIIPFEGEPFTVNKSHILSFYTVDQGIVFLFKNKYVVKWFDGEFKIIRYRFFLQEKKAKEYSLRVEKNKIFDLPLEDYFKLSSSEKEVLKCFWAPVNYPFQSVSIDPYILGLWIGGNSSSNMFEIRTESPKIIKYLEDFSYKNCLIMQKCNVYTYRFHEILCNTFSKELNSLNLDTKHIPQIYKSNCRDYRLLFLAGIIDAESYIKDNIYYLFQESKIVAFDIQDLCRSLGYKCFVNREENYYCIYFYGNGIEDIPVMLENKKIEKSQFLPLVTDFKIIPKGRGKYYGFQIDGNKRFLLGNYMVTHNTGIAIYLLCYYRYKTIILCHIDSLKDQWKEEIIKFTGGKAKVQILRGNKPFDSKADVYIIGVQKATKLEREDVVNIGMVIVDEAHVCTTTAFVKSLFKFLPIKLIGLSATPERVDGLHTLLEIYFGPRKKFIKREEVKDFTVIKYKTKYKPVVSYRVVYGQPTLAWTEMLSSLADIKERWIEIAEIAISEPTHKIILLCDRKEMATNIYDYLLDKGESAELLIGNKKKWDKKKRILVAGVKKGGVGLNDPELTMLIVAADMKNVKQCEGRIRTTDNVVYDIVDDYKTLETHWKLREKWYMKRGAVIVSGGIKKHNKKPISQDPPRFLKPNTGK